jgi:hypothetical protein
MLFDSNGKDVYQASKKLESVQSTGASVQSSVQCAKGALETLSYYSQFLLPYVKLYITFFQVLSSFITFNVTWPSLLLNIMVWLKGTLFLDIVALPGLACLWRGVSFQSRLMTYTLGPLAVIALFLVPVLVHTLVVKFLFPSYERRTEKVVTAVWKNVMFWLFLIYPVVSLSTLEAFNCQPVGLGKLAADFNEPCPGQTHFLTIWSYIFIAVYPVGIPLFCYLSMLKMGVHLVARDIKFSMLLKALVVKYASLNLSSTPKEINQLLADCADDIKITKSQAVDILVTFETLELEAKNSEEGLPAAEKKTEQYQSVSKNGGVCCSCTSLQLYPDQEYGETPENMRKQIQKESNKNPRILYVRLLKLAKKLAHQNTIPNASISWREYRSSLAFKSKKQTVQKNDADIFSTAAENVVNVGDLSQYAIHPDLSDDYAWGGLIRFQTSVGNLLLGIPASWKTFNGRKELGGRALDRIGFVFAAYKVDCWFWEMLEMLRK